MQQIAGRVVRGGARVALTGVTAGLGAWAATAGVRELLKRRADEALQLAAQTPLGRLLPEPEVPQDGAETEAERIAQAARAARDKAIDELREAESPAVANGRPAGGQAQAARPEAEQLPSAADVGAPGVAAPTADAVTEQLQREHSVPSEPTRDDLPIADFDNATVASLRARLRRLNIEELVVLREYEQAHAHRLPVITMLDNRIAKLQEGDGGTDTPAAS